MAETVCSRTADTSASRSCARLVLGSLCLIGVLAGSAGCEAFDGEATAFDLDLIPDLSLNAEAQLAAQLDHVVVVVDSAEGLYAPDQAQVGDGFEIANRDDDDPLELTFTVPVPEARLPLLRLERGGLPDAALEISVRGYADGEQSPLAAGGVSGVRFEVNQVQELPVPFNLLPDRLPPRVVEVFPAEGQLLSDCELSLLVVVFSKAIDVSSLVPNHSVSLRGLALGDFQLTLGRVAQFVVTDESLVGSVSNQIEVGTEVTDEQGRHLDQQPAQAGAQGFASEFLTPASCPQLAGNWCGEVDPILGPGDICPDLEIGRLICQDGVCVPAECDVASCGDGFICDQASGSCEVDCRLYGGVEACPAGQPVCDLETGRCGATT